MTVKLTVKGTIYSSVSTNSTHDENLKLTLMRQTIGERFNLQFCFGTMEALREGECMTLRVDVQELGGHREPTVVGWTCAYQISQTKREKIPTIR